MFVETMTRYFAVQVAGKRSNRGFSTDSEVHRIGIWIPSHVSPSYWVVPKYSDRSKTKPHKAISPKHSRSRALR